MKKLLPGILFASLFVLTSAAAEQDNYFSHRDVPFVPTKHEVVDVMLEMAHVTKDDILYDLGCGDGRIVITAAKNTGARGVGIDIDPERIEESKENAELANVTDRVTFIRQDLFDANISKATVIALYLLPDVNLRLRPKILSEVKPGTRIVSHNYDMDEWEPDISTEVTDAMEFEYDSHSVFFWIVPANVSGTWKWAMQIDTDNEDYEMHVDQKFQEINGKVTAGGREIQLKEMKLTGDRLYFTIEQKVKKQIVPMQFFGRVNSNYIAGSIESGIGSGAQTVSWKASRDPSTTTPLEEW
ncbi:methyltransferase domain-containing protein [Candidatus Latescibacterota bacterium]